MKNKDISSISADNFAHAMWNGTLNKRKGFLKRIRGSRSLDERSMVELQADEIVYYYCFVYKAIFRNVFFDNKEILESLKDSYFKFANEYAVIHNCDSKPWGKFNLEPKTPIENLKRRIEIYDSLLEKEVAEKGLIGIKPVYKLFEWSGIKDNELFDRLTRLLIHTSIFIRERAASGGITL
jgi:hypothetical protein